MKPSKDARTICPSSDTKIHFYEIRLDTAGREISKQPRRCAACGVCLVPNGHLWMSADMYVINEELEIMDVVSSR